MLFVPAAPGWDRYLVAPPLISPLLMEALSSNSYTGDKEVSQASCRSILRQIAVRPKNPPPPLLPLSGKPIR